MSSSSPTSSYSPNLLPIPTNNVTAESYHSGNTVLCQAAVTIYISTINSWTTFTPATCSSYHSSLTMSKNSSSALTTPPTGTVTASLQETPPTDVSTVTEFSSTMITTTVTGSLSTSTQTSNAPKEALGLGLSGITGLIWILYFSHQLLHR